MPAQKLVDMEPSGIPPNNSHQQLMRSEDSDSVDTIVPPLSSSLTESEIGGKRTMMNSGNGISKRQWLTVAVLCYVNLINYMDRFTIAGILTDIQTYFNIRDDKGGLLQTAFVLSYMIFAPVFGYLGDRYSRKAIMAAGVFLWSLTTLLGSFMDDYYHFLLFRTLVGIGEASYSTIAPTIISDMFVQDVRSKMLAFFYFAIPVGSGLGYVIGSETAKAAGAWQYGLRVTPVMGAFAVLLIIFVMQDPPRGESEGKQHLTPTSWSKDIKILCRNSSFMLSTAGFTCVAFVAGALGWWGPHFIYLGLRLQPGSENISLSDVSVMFGLVTVLSGIFGVLLGSHLSRKLRPKFPSIDPVICAVGLLISSVFLLAVLLTCQYHYYTCFLLIFIAEVALNLNWSIVTDVLLYVVTPTRRSTAEALQILVCHAFGDAGSPYLIGLLSELLKHTLTGATAALALSSVGSPSPTPSPEVSFHSLQYALFTTCFVEVLGGFFFLFTALYIVQDKQNAERELEGDVLSLDPRFLEFKIASENSLLKLN